MAECADLVMEACWECLSNDLMVEDSRRVYLMELAARAGIESQLLDRLILAEYGTDSSRDERQRIMLLCHFAQGGSAVALELLKQLAVRGIEAAQDELALVGMPGLQWLLDKVLPTIPNEELHRVSSWREDSGVSIRSLSKEHQRLLRNAQDRWRYHAPKRQVPKRQIQIDLARTLEEFYTETDTKKLRKLSLAIRMNRVPVDPTRLIEIAGNPERDRIYFTLLGKLDSDAVHDFAIKVLQRRPLLGFELEALLSSFRVADTPIVWLAIQEFDLRDEIATHALVSDLNQLIPKIEDPLPFLSWVYDASPCTYCRLNAVAMMVARQCLPPEIAYEATWDCEEDIRELARRVSNCKESRN